MRQRKMLCFSCRYFHVYLDESISTNNYKPTGYCDKLGILVYSSPQYCPYFEQAEPIVIEVRIDGGDP